MQTHANGRCASVITYGGAMTKSSSRRMQLRCNFEPEDDYQECSARRAIVLFCFLPDPGMESIQLKPHAATPVHIQQAYRSQQSNLDGLSLYDGLPP